MWQRKLMCVSFTHVMSQFGAMYATPIWGTPRYYFIDDVIATAKRVLAGTPGRDVDNDILIAAYHPDRTESSVYSAKYAERMHGWAVVHRDMSDKQPASKSGRQIESSSPSDNLDLTQLPDAGMGLPSRARQPRALDTPTPTEGARLPALSRQTATKKSLEERLALEVANAPIGDGFGAPKPKPSYTQAPPDTRPLQRFERARKVAKEYKRSDQEDTMMLSQALSSAQSKSHTISHLTKNLNYVHRELRKLVGSSGQNPGKSYDQDPAVMRVRQRLEELGVSLDKTFDVQRVRDDCLRGAISAENRYVDTVTAYKKKSRTLRRDRAETLSSTATGFEEGADWLSGDTIDAANEAEGRFESYIARKGQAREAIPDAQSVAGVIGEVELNTLRGSAPPSLSAEFAALRSDLKRDSDNLLELGSELAIMLAKGTIEPVDPSATLDIVGSAHDSVQAQARVDEVDAKSMDVLSHAGQTLKSVADALQPTGGEEEMHGWPTGPDKFGRFFKQGESPGAVPQGQKTPEWWSAMNAYWQPRLDRLLEECSRVMKLPKHASGPPLPRKAKKAVGPDRANDRDRGRFRGGLAGGAATPSTLVASACMLVVAGASVLASIA